MRDAVLSRIRDENKLALIAKQLGVSRQAVSMWERVPPLKVLRLAELTGIPPHELRPDLYPPPRRRSARR